ncbi:MAG TPA: 30S ribosomal protein S17 [Pseudogracilibacillus sp.]|nr:30S ribosomal protein S17 [Pseudogracilibacillus sp.]
MTDRNNRKSYVGRVISDDMDRTITVVVESYKLDRLYKKRVKHSKKMKTHDENNTAKNGDIVRIMETRPVSKTKHYRLVEVVEEAVII